MNRYGIFAISFLLLAGCEHWRQPSQGANTSNKEPTFEQSAAQGTMTHSAIADLYASAENGDPQAQFKLGLAYAEGNDTTVNVKEALRWWRKAAKACQHSAHCKLQPPVDFSCKNGRRFTITFLNTRDVAYLSFPDSKTFDVLYNARLGTGIGYRNKRFGFEEHEGHVTLDNLKPRKGQKATTACSGGNKYAKTRTE